MAEKTSTLEREYIIPLRREIRKVAGYERTSRAIKTIKQFIAKHMKVLERDIKNIKLNIDLNNDVWFRGRRKPPAKVKVKAKKEGDIVHVDFVDVPELVKFNRIKRDKRHKKSEKKPAPKVEEKPVEQKTEEQKKEEHKEEKEKLLSVEQQNLKQAEQQAKEHKHLTQVKDPRFHRMALKK